MPDRSVLSVLPLPDSAVEDRPADVVSQPLIIENEGANRIRKLITLPLALAAACRRCLGVVRYGSAYGLDRVRGCTKIMSGDVCHRTGLAGGVGGVPCCPVQIPGGTHRVPAGGPGLHHRDVTAYPGTDVLDRLPRPRIVRPFGLEEI